ncbi:glycosidase [Sinomonas halotolerans]|uniref:Glycosidase n=1 Tax=Sinomonas halotolerans TaxID=1644133 RepID=A0ABU9X0G0_9MICC
MARNANGAEKLDLRLKAVLDGLAEAARADQIVDARAVLAGAVEKVPFDDHEAFLLSGGIPRGHKALTAATAKLVKAGWMVKGRAGWAITEEGLRATVAFTTAIELSRALAAGTPVPAHVALPAAAPAAESLAEAAVQEAAAPGHAVTVEALVAPSALSDEAQVAEAVAVADIAHPDSTQPDAVAIAGDFAAYLGAEADWSPEDDAVQMGLDALTRRWMRTVELPAGHYQFKIALNRSWNENYGAFGAFDGANHELAHDGGPVTIAYDHSTKDIAFS